LAEITFCARQGAGPAFGGIKMQKKIKFLVAQNVNGMFLGLHESFATTSPFECDHPYDAKKVFPYGDDGLTNIRPAPYYFENSDRMRNWLQGYKMVIVEMTINAEIKGSAKC
jgi:hypothetical protein